MWFLQNNFYHVKLKTPKNVESNKCDFKMDMVKYPILISLSDIRQFQDFTFPMYRPRLEINESGYFANILIGATIKGFPVGLAYTAINLHKPGAELFSVYVDKNYRNQGIASRLIQSTCKELVIRKVPSVSAVYITGQPTTAALEHVFVKTKWSIPVTRMLALNFNLNSIREFHAPNLQGLPNGYSILPWIEVLAEERARLISSQEREHWIADDLIPFDFEYNCEPVTSIALKYRNMVVGWCVTHKMGEVLRFTCSFIRRDLARLGMGLIIFNEAIKRMPAIGVTTGMFGIPLHHSGFASFARRRLRPYCTFFGETRGVIKSLKSH
jgi:GNAT superfamily N-acetyltransferase